MWVYSRPRSEHDVRFMLNLAMSSRINLTQLGGRWFVEVMMGTESVPIASASTEAEARKALQLVFESLRAGASALDLVEATSGAREDGYHSQDVSPAIAKAAGRAE